MQAARNSISAVGPAHALSTVLPRARLGAERHGEVGVESHAVPVRLSRCGVEDVRGTHVRFRLFSRDGAATAASKSGDVVERWWCWCS